jgi:hypothetical protein
MESTADMIRVRVEWFDLQGHPRLALLRYMISLITAMSWFDTDASHLVLFILEGDKTVELSYTLETQTLPTDEMESTADMIRVRVEWSLITAMSWFDTDASHLVLFILEGEKVDDYCVR